jgi:hypothetical protein
MTDTEVAAGAHFTCFTSTKVQTLTQKELQANFQPRNIDGTGAHLLY